ncbi:MAG: hypothetical protein AB7I35_17295 [Ramlibacter sp.]
MTALSCSHIQSVSRLWVGVWALALGCTAWPTAAAAEEGKLMVTATIAKRASLKVLAQPAVINLTAQDISRGFVEVASPMQIAVQNNSLDGYMLVLSGHGGFVRQARMRGLDTEVQLGAEGGVVTQRSHGGGGVHRAVVALTFRFELTETARQGEYAWPIHMDIRPL